MMLRKTDILKKITLSFREFTISSSESTVIKKIPLSRYVDSINITCLGSMTLGREELFYIEGKIQPQTRSHNPSSLSSWIEHLTLKCASL